jgi:hypothetical protein
MIIAKRRSAGGEGGAKWTGPQDADARQAQRDLVEEVRREARRRGVEWAALLERAALSKASRSRVNTGIAGISTIGRLRRALEELTTGSSSARAESEDVSTRQRSHGDAAAPDRRRRWVVVQRQDRQMFVGIASESDDEIAEKGRVRLDRCRPIQSLDASAASLAAAGPSDRGIAGPEVPSALVLAVAVVYDATKAAVRAFEARK